jgi:hypothetical protein
VHHIQPAAHVEKVNDAKAKETNQSFETKTGLDPSPDSTGSSSNDSSPNDNSIEDPKGQP